jgi:hypothetical protein
MIGRSLMIFRSSFFNGLLANDTRSVFRLCVDLGHVIALAIKLPVRFKVAAIERSATNTTNKTTAFVVQNKRGE